MPNANHDSPFEDMLADHMRLTKLAEKATTTPKGRQSVGNAGLRERWPRIGKDERRRILAEGATEDDPEGVYAFLDMMGEA